MDKFSKAYAKKLDREDPLAGYRKKFHIPNSTETGKKSIYLCGNSLGLQPKGIKKYFDQELKHWADYGVQGHEEGDYPWLYYHHQFTDSLARLVGARKTEVVAMNTLTVNLHILMASFYRPTPKRYKIIMEAGAFPSDQYAMASQAQMHGYKPAQAVIEAKPRKGEDTLRTEDILELFQLHGKETAVLMMGGVHYYTGQLLDMKTITAFAKKKGIKVGFDLAHAVGNVPLKLHNWGVDFAAWCSYKYLNSGPGGVSGIYIHEKYATDPKTPRLTGWWGYEEDGRFKMPKKYKPMLNAQSWQMSNAPVFNMIAHLASLEIFDEVGMTALRQKSKKLTAYLRGLIESCTHLDLSIITPKAAKDSGAQLSLDFGKDGKEVYRRLSAAGIVADWREPSVIRIAPAPLYNTYEEAWKFYEILMSLKK